MKKSLLFISIILVCFVIISCSQEEVRIPFGSLSLTFGEETSRTIRPSDNELSAYISITNYSVSGEYLDQCQYANVQTSFSINTTESSINVENLIAGTWEITVNGFNSSNVIVAEKTVTVSIIQNETASATFKLQYLHSGYGILDFTFRVPSSQPVIKVIGELTSTSSFLETEEIIEGIVVKTPTVIRFEIEKANASTEEEGAVFVYHIIKEDIPVGSYVGQFYMVDSDGDVVGLPITEAVHIYNGLTDAYSWTWSEYFFASAPPAPQISLESGCYSVGQTVTVTEDDPLATIYYTLDGTTPSETNGTEYTMPITLQENSSFRVIAKKGKLTSQTVEREYSIIVESPVIETTSGTYTSPQTVSISCSTSGASIYYYTDLCSTPVLYSTGVEIEENTTLYAYATKLNLTNSLTVSETYIIDNQRSGIWIENPDTSDYGLEIFLPDSWESGIPVKVGVTATLVAPRISKNTGSGENTVYNTVWLIDGEEIVYPNGSQATGAILKLGTNSVEYSLQAGGHIITVKTVVEDRVFTANCLILVSFDGITTGTNSHTERDGYSGGTNVYDKGNYDNGYRYSECVEYSFDNAVSYEEIVSTVNGLSINGHNDWEIADYMFAKNYISYKYPSSTKQYSSRQSDKTVYTHYYAVLDGTLKHVRVEEYSHYIGNVATETKPWVYTQSNRYEFTPIQNQYEKVILVRNY